MEKIGGVRVSLKVLEKRLKNENQTKNKLNQRERII